MTVKYSGKFILKLKKLGIRHFDVLIHDQSREWLIENFHQRAKRYKINVTKLMRNIVWQTRERIINGQKPPLNELIRTFWYMYIKPTLSRAGALSDKPDNQYRQLVAIIVDLVKKYKLMRYSDIGFRDENQAHRKVGKNAHIILFSEKLGHQQFLSEMRDKYDCSIIALGGKPSVLNIEYFVDDMKARGINLRRTVYLFSVVDFDPHGWIVRNSFIEDLKHYGIKNIKCMDMITPDMLTEEEVKISRYRLPQKSGKQWRLLNKWLKEIRKKKYRNERFLIEEERVRGKLRRYYCGLESESVSTKRMSKRLAMEIIPLIRKK